MTVMRITDDTLILGAGDTPGPDRSVLVQRSGLIVGSVLLSVPESAAYTR